MDRSNRQTLDLFFRDSKQKAYLMAMALTHNHHDAHGLVQKYRHRDADEWGPLFIRILQNPIRNWFRKQKFRQALTGLMPWQASSTATENFAASAEDQLWLDDALKRVIMALNKLPLRQQQTLTKNSLPSKAYILQVAEFDATDFAFC